MKSTFSLSRFKTAALSVVFVLMILPIVAMATIELPDFGNLGTGLETSALTLPSLTTQSLTLEPVKCKISLDASEVITGGDVTVYWQTTGVNEVTINGETMSDLSGHMTISNITENKSFELKGYNDLGKVCKTTVTLTCLPPTVPLRCDDFGYDFEIGKFEWNNNTYEQESLESGYSINVSGDADTANWTANPAVAGVIAKAATVIEEFTGGTSGSVNKSDIGTGKHGISNIAFCGKKEEPKGCELTLTKAVNKTDSKSGEQLTYTIKVENTGDEDCTGGGVKIYDVVDSNLEFLGHNTSGNLSAGYGGTGVYTASDRTLRFNGHVLTPGEIGTIEWTGKVIKSDKCEFKVKNVAKATARELNYFKDWSFSNEVVTNIKDNCDKPTPPECPISPAPDRIIVDFADEKLRSDQNLDAAQTDIQSINFPAGEYDIRLVSWDGYIGRENTTQLLEQYQLEFVNGGNSVAVSSPISDLADKVQEATNNELVNTKFNLPSDATGIRGVHAFFGDTSSANSLYPICAALDPIESEPKDATLIADKIVCTDEADLPNFGNGGPDMTANTAADWVASHASCSLQAGWEFEWGETAVSNPDDSLPNSPFYGKAGSGWNTFGLTDGNGRVSTQIPASVIADNSFLWVREVLQEGYIPFTFGPGNQTNADNVSAEVYCHTDVKNYDNFDRVDGIAEEGTYYCVAWNSKIPVVTPDPKCDFLNANPAAIDAGDSTTLSWGTTNAVQAFLNGTSVDVDGSTVVSPTSDTTYVLTAIGDKDKVDECRVKVEVDDTPERPECPFIPGPGITVVEFDPERIRSDKSLGNSQTKIELVNLEAGKYNIDLASWDSYPSRVNVTQPNERWKLEFLSGDSQVGLSDSIGDLEDKVAFAYLEEQVNAKYALGSSADGVRAVHAVYPDLSSPNSVEPICAKIEWVEDPAPSCDLFTANPSTIYVGNSSTLTWETSNAERVVINNGIGEVTPIDGGSVSVSPLVDTTYQMTVFGTDDRSVNCEVPVKVSEDPVPVCELFTATPSQLPIGGGDVELNWEVEDATTVTISPTVGSVGLIGSASVAVTESTTFTLTAVDANDDEVSCEAPVTVPDPVPFTCENNVSFNASPNSVRSGSDVTLTWDVTNADSVSISEINATSFSGSEVVNPTSDTTYVLTATYDNESIECPASVTVSTGGGGGGSSSPRCELDISDQIIKLGDEITITWDTSRAYNASLVDDLGNTIFDTDDMLSTAKDDYLDGSITLSPTRDTEYTLTAERGSKTRTCRVAVELEDDIVIIETRDQQPLVAGISLTAVPYTGFEAGPLMTFLFYALLVAWAFYIAYIVVARPTATATGVSKSADRRPEDINPDVFVKSVSPEATVNVATATPDNLPVAEPVVGYGENQGMDAAVTAIEDRAHSQKALLSSDAIRHFVATTEGAVERNEALDEVISEAKKTYPLEDGWIVINESRMQNLCETCKVHAAEHAAESFTPNTVTVPEGSSSLAEAIVTGNVVAAYEMIGHRPMFSLADAAADLDAVYRNRQGADNKVSELLEAETEKLSDSQIKDMISSLTSALDGTYTDEASAVKMAIMKAVKEVA